ncbi:MAG: tetratricopeptide repeat protein [Acidobacteriota bacterium]
MSSPWKILLPSVLVLFAVACGTTTAPAPATVPASPSDGLIDPRTDSVAPLPSAYGKRFESAWRNLQSGNFEVAYEGFSNVLRKYPQYTPAILGQAAVNVQRQEFDEATAKVADVLASQPENFAALYYRAEIEYRRGENQAALQHFQSLAGQDQYQSLVQERITALRSKLFNDLYAKATREANAAEAAETLRQALALQPEATAARLLLVQKLIETSRFDDARRQIEPLLHASDTASKPDVLEALARIDIGKSRYQEAITRYEQLARTYPGRYDQQLADVKQRWVEMNLPPQYQTALASKAITRTDLAVLVFWDLPMVRFASNLPEPPIAVDIPTVMGREEFVRALSLGLFTVDSVTRRAYPDRPLSSSSFLRIATRLMTLRGAPACAGGAVGDTDAARSVSVLTSCGIPLGGLNASTDIPLTGRQASAILEGIRRKLGSTEER